MSYATILPDVMVDVRYWLRNHPTLIPLHGKRVFFRIPTTNPGSKDEWSLYPVVRIYRSGGTIQDTGGGAPVQDVNIAIDCWSNGPPQRQGYDYGGARMLAQGVQSVIHDLGYAGNTAIGAAGGTVILDATVTNVLDSPDPGMGWPRLVVDSRWTVLPVYDPPPEPPPEPVSPAQAGPQSLTQVEITHG